MSKIVVENNRISITTRGANYKIPLNEIIYIESNLRKIEIYTIRHSYSFYEKLDSLEKYLENHGFFRCHQSYLISSSQILCYDNHMLYLNDTDVEIPVSRQHQQELRLYMQQHDQHGILTCIQGTYEGYIVKMKPEQPVIIGRDGNVCDIVIQLPMISRLHCEITYHQEDDIYEITDYSSNGTFIHDSVRLIPKQRYVIKPGTELCFGDRTSIFVLK